MPANTRPTAPLATVRRNNVALIAAKGMAALPMRWPIAMSAPVVAAAATPPTITPVDAGPAEAREDTPQNKRPRCVDSSPAIRPSNLYVVDTGIRTFTVAAPSASNIFVLMRIFERASSVLIVEDNVRLVALLERALREHGFVVRAFRDRESALASALANEPDVFVLDIGLRGPNDGIELVQELRARGIGAPALMLTGRNEVEDRIAGLNAGADDYLGKPFEVDELIARIRALVRRARRAERNPRLIVGNLALDPSTGEVHRGRRKLSLTQREFAVLQYFMRHPGKELARQAIAEEVWNGLPASPETTNIVDVYVNYLRKKLGAKGEKPMLHTVRGVGYVLRASEKSRPRPPQKKRRRQ